MGRNAGGLVLTGTLAATLLAASACTPKDSQTADDGQTRLTATLTGAAEAPTPADSDGQGTATVTLDQAKGQVCYTISVSNLDSVTAAHIHKGAAGVAGPVAVALQPPTGGQIDSCAQADSATIEQIAQHPADYYVNVHDAQFPKGAVRGQLQPTT